MQTEDLWLDIIKEMEGRRKIGLETYGVPVTADECVDWCEHLTSELYDAVVYARAFKGVVEKLKLRITHLEEQNAELREENKRLQEQVDYFTRGGDLH